MADDIQLDGINEDDIIAALADVPSVELLATKPVEVKQVQKVEQPLSINLDSSDANDIVNLLKQLLDGKTLEISIKVKN